MEERKVDQMRKLGVIGGLGPAATAYFLELIIKMTDAHCDQEHLETIIYNCPRIPDRTNYILNPSNDSPVNLMVHIGKSLVEQGVHCIAIPCITAHYFYDDLLKTIKMPIIHAVKETAIHLKENGVRTAGIIASDGTITSELFQRQLIHAGIDPIVPANGSQHDAMNIVYRNIKAGRPAQMDKFYSIVHELRKNGAEVIILGCTELSLIKRDCPIGAGYIDAMEVLAKTSIINCHGRLKKQYKCLITH